MKINSITTDNKIVVFQGGTCSGKTSLCRMLTDRGVPKVITCTTRKPKEGEKDNADYFFKKNKEEFLKTDLIEYQEYSGNLYGTSREEIENKLKDNKVVCTIMESAGAKKLKESYPDNIIVISLPITKDYMLANMIKRHETNEEINRRLSNFKKLNEDKPVDFADYILYGNDLEIKWDRVLSIIKEECGIDLKNRR